MKRVVLCTFILWGSLVSYGQIKFEAQVGGSNFLGITLNTAFDINISDNGHHKIIPSLGLGFLVPGWDYPTTIIHFGLDYRYKRWGIGSEVSGFTINPFWGEGYNPFVDMIIYPNINYTFGTKSSWYFKISAGAYFAFSKRYDSASEKTYMGYDGDVIPGAGFSVGYKF
ncbi:MAG TPA: hypothetical protein ENH85_05105 [Candidatus Scalindua sp.]|nr:hypothetical protein [Candidatus Scalindua sp.]